MFIKFLKEILFPLFCVMCDAEGKLICDVCMLSVEKQTVFSCPLCHTINANGNCCKDCEDKKKDKGKPVVIEYGNFRDKQGIVHYPGRIDTGDTGTQFSKILRDAMAGKVLDQPKQEPQQEKGKKGEPRLSLIDLLPNSDADHQMRVPMHDSSHFTSYYDSKENK